MLSRASTSYGQPPHDPWQELAPPPATSLGAWSTTQRLPPRTPTLPYAVPRRGKRILFKLFGTIGVLGGVFLGGVFARPAVERKAHDVVDGLPLGIGEVIRAQTGWRRATDPVAIVTPAVPEAAKAAIAAPSVTPLPASASEPAPTPVAAGPTVEPLPAADKPAVEKIAARPVAAAEAPVEEPAPAAEAVVAKEVDKAIDKVAAPARPTASAAKVKHAARPAARVVAIAAPRSRVAKEREPEAAKAVKVAPAVVEKKAVAAAPEPEPARASEPSDPLEKLMAGAVTGKKTSRREAKSVEEALNGGGERETAAPVPPALQAAAAKKTLSRDQIVQSLRTVQGDVDECAKRFHKTGGADVEISVDRDGTVQKAKATGTNAGTPLGKCLEEAVASADFPTSDGLKFPYRLTLR